MIIRIVNYSSLTKLDVTAAVEKVGNALCKCPLENECPTKFSNFRYVQHGSSKAFTIDDLMLLSLKYVLHILDDVICIAWHTSCVTCSWDQI